MTAITCSGNCDRLANITPQVEEALRESGIGEGLCLVKPLHITASVFINDDASGLHDDYDAWLEKIATGTFATQHRLNPN